MCMRLFLFVLPRNNNRMTNVGYKKSIASTLTKIARGGMDDGTSVIVGHLAESNK